MCSSRSPDVGWDMNRLLEHPATGVDPAVPAEVPARGGIPGPHLAGRAAPDAASTAPLPSPTSCWGDIAIIGFFFIGMAVFREAGTHQR